jgi:hypothetical protein
VLLNTCYATEHLMVAPYRHIAKPARLGDRRSSRSRTSAAVVGLVRDVPALVFP